MRPLVPRLEKVGHFLSWLRHRDLTARAGGPQAPGGRHSQSHRAPRDVQGAVERCGAGAGEGGVAVVVCVFGSNPLVENGGMKTLFTVLCPCYCMCECFRSTNAKQVKT